MKTNTDVVLRADGLSKEYRLYASARERFRALFTRRALHRSHWALDGVSFELGRGQCLGVIGDNGAGKSTLLKLLTGTIQPSSGSVWHAGRVTAILELGAGFHPEFSGRDNLYFGGSLIGIDQEEMARLEPEIAAFSELGEALQRPVKTYSSGMVVRLAFALVTAVQPDVLIIDEALAVGDQHFQKKCVERILAFRENGCTILFCSHSFYHVRRLCDSALWLRDGQLAMQGPTEQVVSAYEVYARSRTMPAEALAPPAEAPAAPAAGVPGPRVGARIVAMSIDQTDGAEPPLLLGPDLRVRVTVRLEGSDEAPQVLVMLEQFQGHGIATDSTRADGVQPQRLLSGDWQVVLTYPDLPLHSGEYVLSAYLFDATGVVVYDEWYQHARFRYVNPQLTPGLVRPAALLGRAVMAGAWRRARREARDALELCLLPGLAAVLPWPVAFRVFKVLARCDWLYRESCQRALASARAMGMAGDAPAWLAERRLVTLVDHADHYLFRWRSAGWMRRFVDVSGQWQEAGRPGLLVTFHWGAGLWCLRHAAAQGLHPHMLVAATDGPPFEGRWFLRRYVKARMDTVRRASGRPVIYAQGGLPQVRDALAAREQVLVVLDVPPDQVGKTCTVSLLGRPVRVPRVLPSLAVQQNLPLTVVLMNVDLRTGRRGLELETLEPGEDEAALTQALFARLERVMLSRPASWHLWGEAQRFFST